ncbi:MAG TPA: hypothetical protein VFN61_07440 [Acidimicrobiales bacterium]|nr:hypothetical protein [Acidimicrobiales bacterium]
MAMRPIGREEAGQHLFVMATAAFIIIAPFFMVQPPALEYTLVALGVLFAFADLLALAAMRRPRPE